MTISIQTRLSRSTVREGEPAALYLLVQITAPDEGQRTRPPLNLAAVVDRSGSMHGPKLAYTRQALRFLVDQTGAGDYLSITAFDDEVLTIAPTAHVTNKDALKAQIGQIEAGGSTNLSGGLLAGIREVRRHHGARGIHRVLLMTDGQANVGVTDPAALTAKARQMHEQGIQLSALGVGADFNEDLLAAMAEAGGGNFHFIANPDELPAIFAEELQGLLATVAQGLELQFRAAPGVAISRVVGYPPAGTPGEIRISLPDLHAGETKSLVLALDVEPAFAGERWLGRLELQGEEAALCQDVAVTIADSTAPEDTEVMQQVGLARSAEALDRAIEAADRQDFAGAAAILREASGPLGDPQLAFQAEALSNGQYDAVARKQMRAQSFRNRPGRR